MLQSSVNKAAVPALLTVLLLTACGGGDQGAARQEAASVPALDTIAVAAGGADGERLFDGTIEAVQQATLVAQTAGRIVAMEHDVDAAVGRGDIILRITAVEQKAAVDRASAMAVEARARYQRVSELRAQRLVAEADLDRATADRDAAEAALATAREQLSYTEVRAPFAGVVTRRFVEVGEAVNPGQPLTAVAALGALRVVVDVPQAMADRVRRLGAASVYAGQQVIPSAGITVFPSAASGSNTVRVRVELPADTKGLVPGMFVKAGFQSGEDAILRVPVTAVMLRSEVTAVYVVDAEGRPILRQVRLGRRLGDDFEVLAGLATGERIAADPVAATLAVEGR
jgi:RND family efflux transporter MFP subunit